MSSTSSARRSLPAGVRERSRASRRPTSTSRWTTSRARQTTRPTRELRELVRELVDDARSASSSASRDACRSASLAQRSGISADALRMRCRRLGIKTVREGRIVTVAIGDVERLLGNRNPRTSADDPTMRDPTKGERRRANGPPPGRHPKEALTMNDSRRGPRSEPHRVSRSTPRRTERGRTACATASTASQRAVPIAARSDTEATALAWAMLAKAEHGESDGQTVLDLLPMFLERARLADSTKGLYESRIRKFAGELAAKPMNEVTVHDVRAWLHSLCELRYRGRPYAQARNTAARIAVASSVQVRRPQRRRRRQPLLAVGPRRRDRPSRRGGAAHDHRARGGRDRGRDRIRPRARSRARSTRAHRDPHGAALGGAAGVALGRHRPRQPPLPADAAGLGRRDDRPPA